MPRRLERRLKLTAKRRGYGKRRTAAYVYGTMNRLGLLHSRKRRQNRK